MTPEKLNILTFLLFQCCVLDVILTQHILIILCISWFLWSIYHVNFVLISFRVWFFIECWCLIFKLVVDSFGFCWWNFVLQAQAAVQGPVGTDFKPLSSTPATTTEPPKPTFPAYTQSTASTTSTTNSTAAKPAASITSKPATLTTTSATSKLIHPDEDISLVSCLQFFTSRVWLNIFVAACPIWKVLICKMMVLLIWFNAY